MPPDDLKKFVLIIAPHTSMWDFVWGKLILSSSGYSVKFLIKKEMFWFPIGSILKFLGGIPVDRRKGGKMVQHVVEEFEKNSEFVIAITPEGTRAKTTKWKRGFYNIARLADVPIAVGYLDYSCKRAGVEIIIKPTGDFNKDFKVITNVYKDKHGKYPEKFSLPLTDGKTKGEG